MEITIITGLSGAGKSVAIKSMEDLGYFCVDNLPPSLLLKMVELGSQSDASLEHLAVGIDVRGGEFFEDLSDSLDELDRGGVPYRIIFLEADEETLINRFKETRRSHPIHSMGGISESISRERELLQALRGRADIVIDTSRINVHQLREQLMNQYRSEGKEVLLEISLVSFGYKYGIPLDADMVFDVRFLPNPHYDPRMRPMTGLDEEVREFVEAGTQAGEFYGRLMPLLDFLIPAYVAEGKSHLTIAIGCTGGRHRSVTVAERLWRDLSKRDDVIVRVSHRDLV